MFYMSERKKIGISDFHITKYWSQKHGIGRAVNTIDKCWQPPSLSSS